MAGKILAVVLAVLLFLVVGVGVLVVVAVISRDTLLSSMATPRLGSSPRVVIIGAGIGGASCAYHLKKQVPGAKVTILEARDRIGGRIRDVTFFGQTVHTGAAAYSAHHRNIRTLVEELGLEVDQFPNNGSYPVTNAVWDGSGISWPAQLLQGQTTDDSALKDRIRSFLAAVDVSYRAHEEKAFVSVPAFLEAGGLGEYSRRSAGEFLGAAGVSETAQTYAVETVMREFFGQSLASSSLLAMTCLGGIYHDAFQTKGGMGRLVEATIRATDCEVDLNSPVTMVTKTEPGTFEVTYGQGEYHVTTLADAVVIAAPLEHTGIKFEGFENDPSRSQPTREWQRLYCFVCYVAAKSLRPGYFKQKTGTSFPGPPALYTTANTSQPWVVMRQMGSSRGHTIYSVFSAQDVSAGDLLRELFDDVQESASYQWDYVCPVDVPQGAEERVYQSIVLDDRLYSLNGLESVATQMEMSVTGGRNIAKLIAKEV